RRGKDAEHQTGEVLFDADEPLLRDHLRSRTARPIRWGRRENQLVAGEPRDGRISVLCGNLVLANELIRQFAIDFEFDRNEVVAAELTRPAGRGERRYRRQALFTAQCFARGGDDSLRRRRLSTNHTYLANHQ